MQESKQRSFSPAWKLFSSHPPVLCINTVLTGALDQDWLFSLFVFDQTTLLFGNADFRRVSSDPQAAMGPTNGPSFLSLN